MRSHADPSQHVPCSSAGMSRHDVSNPPSTSRAIQTASRRQLEGLVSELESVPSSCVGTRILSEHCCPELSYAS